jgi:hypothetical protein
MNNRMEKILEGKREARKRLAALPFSEKIKLLEQLRDRSLAIAASPLKKQFSHRG